MKPYWTSPLTSSEVYAADARLVAAALPEGIASCAILDGPYGLGKAEWDRIPRGGTLGDLYTGHLDDVGRICSKSASLYVWNTSRGLMDLDPLILARGWMFRTLIVWDKVTPPSLLGWQRVTSWIDSTEVCGFYTRGDPAFTMPEPMGSVWQVSTGALSHEVLRSGIRVPNKAGSDGLKESALHPCQKPLLFAERMIRASTRPGDTVWVPFGGTLRELVAAERIARSKREEARRVITCELNADGVDYIGPAIAQAQGLAARQGQQLSLV